MGRTIRNKVVQPAIDTAIDTADNNKNKLKTWTNSTRPEPAEGEYPFGINTDLDNKMEYWNGSEWKASGSGGGDINEPGGNDLLMVLQ